MSALAVLIPSVEDMGMDATPDETAPEPRKLVTSEVAEMTGMKPASWRSRVNRGMAPKPDGRFDGRTPWWWESTVRRFIAERKPPGRPRIGRSKG